MVAIMIMMGDDKTELDKPRIQISWHKLTLLKVAVTCLQPLYQRVFQLHFFFKPFIQFLFCFLQASVWARQSIDYLPSGLSSEKENVIFNSYICRCCCRSSLSWLVVLVIKFFDQL